jgi:hypothetical protein
MSGPEMEGTDANIVGLLGTAISAGVAYAMVLLAARKKLLVWREPVCPACRLPLGACRCRKPEENR